MADTTRVGVLWRQNAAAENERARLQSIFVALSERGVEAVPVLYSDDAIDAARSELVRLDGVLVWVDPIAFGEDRSRLDPLLREAAARGVYVSAHPDVILKLGTKEVLYTTKSLGWGVDTWLYRTPDELRQDFPRRLAAGPRVLKQYRGNGGNGVWKVELLRAEQSGGDADGWPVRVLHAQRNSLEEDTTLGAFLRRCEGYFAGQGRLIDQPFQQRLPEGMIRCYLSQATVIGFAHQFIRALMPAPAGSDPATLPQPGPRIMQPPDAPGFERLRRAMEDEWLPAACRLLGLDVAELPVLWDADFLFGPKNAAGEDSYVLCEINVSCITPFPEFAAGQIVENALRRVRAAQEVRR